MTRASEEHVQVRVIELDVASMVIYDSIAVDDSFLLGIVSLWSTLWLSKRTAAGTAQNTPVSKRNDAGPVQVIGHAP